jgi:hypothetical protein
MQDPGQAEHGGQPYVFPVDMLWDVFGGMVVRLAIGHGTDVQHRPGDARLDERPIVVVGPLGEELGDTDLTAGPSCC